VRGVADRGARRPPIKLLGNARVCFTVDIAFEGFLRACQYRGRPVPPDKPDLYSLSFAEYGLRVGVWRLLDLLAECGIRGSCLTNGYAAQQYPATLKAVADAGHEIVAHGWTNDAGIASDDVEIERKEVRRTLDAIVAAVDQSPVGWLSPGYAGSPARRVALSEAGVFYSCDDARDDLPYVIDVEGKPHVIVPRTSFHSNDLENWFHAQNPPSAFNEMFRSQFDAIYEEAATGRPGWMEFILHAHFAGRLQAIGALRKMIKYVMSHEGIWVAPRGDLARWILDHPDYHG
jgi:peptidoglycan/xylan/chitin deacetylase (PgdA/CDA1 family)